MFGISKTTLKTVAVTLVALGLVNNFAPSSVKKLVNG